MWLTDGPVDTIGTDFFPWERNPNCSSNRTTNKQNERKRKKSNQILKY